MTTPTTPPPRRDIWLVSGARTASSLLLHMFNLDEQDVQVGGKQGGYYFFPSVSSYVAHANKPLNTWTEDELTKWHTQAQKDFDAFQENHAVAREKGKTSFTKEHITFVTTPYFESLHAHGPSGVEGLEPVTLKMKGVEEGSRSEKNLTVFPDEFLRTMTPAFLIRHPALQLPSLWRTCPKMMHVLPRPGEKPLILERTFKWPRALYEFYAAHFGPECEWPLVVDADDIMTSPELVKTLASKIGLDPTKVKFAWEKMSEEELATKTKGGKVMLSSLYASDKVDTGKVAGEIDIDKEAVKWWEEFGEEGGGELEAWVRDCMPDYEFLRSKRLRLDFSR